MNNKETAYRGGVRSYTGGSFANLGTYADWWSSTASDGSNAWYRELTVANAALVRKNASYKTHGLSVRCAGI